MDLQAAAEKLGLEKEEYLEIVELFIETCSSEIEELEKALAAGDKATVERLTHSLKGSSGNIGIMNFSEIARKMEVNVTGGLLEGMEKMVAELKTILNDLKKEV